MNNEKIKYINIHCNPIFKCSLSSILGKLQEPPIRMDEKKRHYKSHCDQTNEVGLKSGEAISIWGVTCPLTIGRKLDRPYCCNSNSPYMSRGNTVGLPMIDAVISGKKKSFRYWLL